MTSQDNQKKYSATKANNSKIQELLLEAATCMTKRDLIGGVVNCTEALAKCEESRKYEVLIKRSECFERLLEFEKALNDVLLAIKCGEKHSTVSHHLCVRYLLKLGDLESAEKFLHQHPEIFRKTQGENYFLVTIRKLRNFLTDIDDNSNDSEKCLAIISEALMIAPHSKDFLALKIKYLVLTKQIEKAKEVDLIINKRCGKILKLSEAFNIFHEGGEKCNFDEILKTLNIKAISDMQQKVERLRTGFERGELLKLTVRLN